jgi:hypothetical protein
MAVSEPDRLDLYRGLEETLGKRRAEIFMRMMTSIPWTEVATKSDLAELRGELRQEMAELRAEMQRALRVQLLSIITVVGIFNAMTVAALRLL